MTSAQKLVLVVAMIMIVAINAWYATGLRFLSNSVQHIVEPPYASAYVPTHNQHSAISIQSIEGSSFKDTGEKVLFYIRNDYCGVSEYSSSRITLVIIALTLLAWWASGRHLPREHK